MIQDEKLCTKTQHVKLKSEILIYRGYPSHRNITITLPPKPIKGGGIKHERGLNIQYSVIIQYIEFNPFYWYGECYCLRFLFERQLKAKKKKKKKQAKTIFYIQPLSEFTDNATIK